MTGKTWRNVSEATVPGWFTVVDGYAPGDTLKIATSKGVILVAPGEWIVESANGEIYTMTDVGLAEG
jgi:hypothetical protein